MVPTILTLLRQKKGITRQELAEEIGVDVVTICRYENGTRTPSLKAAQALAKALDCTLDELIAEEQEEDDGNSQAPEREEG